MPDFAEDERVACRLPRYRARMGYRMRKGKGRLVPSHSIPHRPCVRLPYPYNRLRINIYGVLLIILKGGVFIVEDSPVTDGSFINTW